MKSKVEIMQEIREYRNNQLIELGDNRVFYTMLQSLEPGENTGKQIYRLVEEYSTEENQSEIREFFYEYDGEKPILIAQINPEMMNKIDPEHAEDIIPVSKKYDDKEWELTVEDIQKGIEKIQDNMQEQALRVGLDEEEIKGLAEIDLDKKIRDKIEETNKEDELNQEQEDEQKINGDEKNDDEPINISEEKAERCGITGMNTLNLEQKVGVHGESLRDQIGFNDPQFSDIEKLMVIPTYKLKYIKEFEGRIPDVPFVVVGQKVNGKGLKAFPESVARPYKGENNETTVIGEDSINRDKPDSIIEFPGKNTSISIRQTNPYGIVEATLDYKDRDNSGRVSLELKNEDREGKEKIDTDVQKAVDPHNGREYYDNVLDEVDKHPKNEDLRLEDADGIVETASHIHNIEETSLFNDAVEKIMNECKLYNDEPVKAQLLSKLEQENKFENGTFIGNEEDLKQVLETVVEEIIEEQNELYRGINDGKGF